MRACFRGSVYGSALVPISGRSGSAHIELFSRSFTHRLVLVLEKEVDCLRLDKLLSITPQDRAFQMHWASAHAGLLVPGHCLLLFWPSVHA